MVSFHTERGPTKTSVLESNLSNYISSLLLCIIFSVNWFGHQRLWTVYIFLRIIFSRYRLSRVFGFFRGDTFQNHTEQY